ncbi:hypothetical protein ASF61_10850 [Duganella sp. Leaf126]|uniref:DUF7684 family protein n=1 Tax=Duganella sp. Leaf126 TaxID=1736266 RepID=UPI0006FEE46D|nr:hypothetical protein [Duganella sp. Leaf126]KQQ33565.1 hypothetical protein ASF61_10850 [Duganella sp. Leaf126]
MKKNPPRYLHLAPEAALPALEALDNFKAVLVVEVDVLDTVRWDISRWLVASGCKLAMVWARDAEAWRESIDDAHLEATDYEDLEEADLLIVSAHQAEQEGQEDGDSEDLDEVFWYARHRASHPAHELHDTLIVHIADAPRREDIEDAFADA